MNIEETKQAIEALPDSGRLALNPTAVYESDEWGMNRHLTIRTDGDVEIADLKAVAADHTRLSDELYAAQKVEDSVLAENKMFARALMEIADYESGDDEEILRRIAKQALEGK